MGLKFRIPSLRRLNEEEVLTEASAIQGRVFRNRNWTAQDQIDVVSRGRYDEVSRREVARVLQNLLTDADGPALLDYANAPVQVEPQ
jgi:hypothetical protein